MPTKAKVKYIERALKNDIFWAVKYGPGFDAGKGAIALNTSDNPHKFTWAAWSSSGAANCGGVCAIGACVLNRQLPSVRLLKWIDMPEPEKDYRAAAKFFDVDVAWMYDLYSEICTPGFTIDPVITALAKELCAYGENLMAQRHDLRHAAGQEDQEYAERLGLA